MRIRNFIAALIAGLMLISAVANAQSWSPPSPRATLPFELGRVLAMDMPLFGTRRFDIHTKRTGSPMGSNKRYTNEVLVISEIGQVGTQFDMFSHQSIDNRHYNCFATDDIITRNGFAKLGVDKGGTGSTVAPIAIR